MINFVSSANVDRLSARKLGAMLCAAVLTGCATASKLDGLAAEVPAAPAPGYEIVLKPTLDASGEVDAIEVRSLLTGGLQADATNFEMMAPVVYVKVEGIADRIKNLSVTDAVGEVTFTTQDGEPVPGGFPYFRTWTATRDVQFPVRISYRALVQPPESLSGPAFGIRPSAGGVSGSGAGFLLVPSNADAPVSHLSWDLSAFPGEAIGVTTFGEGDVSVEGSPASLMQGWLMAGEARRHPEASAKSRFDSYWLGAFPYDVKAEMIFSEHMYKFFSTFFTHLDPAPEYRVFLRQLDTPPFGGATALGNSFMLSRGPAKPEEVGGPGPRQTFAHEMIHQWVGGLAEPHGMSTWFHEGLTTYYEYTLPFRAGEISFEQYVDGLNHLSSIYYTNPGREMSAEAIVGVGFNDEDIRHVPYQRDALYFADLDARVRAASDGEHGLDTLMKRVFRLRESGELELTLANWGAEAARETGENEYARVIAVNITGELVVPSGEGFGRCVEGVPGAFEAEGTSVTGVAWRATTPMTPTECFRLQPAPQRAG